MTDPSPLPPGEEHGKKKYPGNAFLRAPVKLMKMKMVKHSSPVDGTYENLFDFYYFLPGT